MSSRYGIATLDRWKFAGTFMSPNGILTHSYNVQDVTKNAVAALLSLLTKAWRYAWYARWYVSLSIGRTSATFTDFTT